MALLSSTAGRLRDWTETLLNIAFPWPETNAAPPVPITRPFCELCGDPYPALDYHGQTFQCANCEDRIWHIQWARAAYRTEGQVLESISRFKYHDESFRFGQLTHWLVEAFDLNASREKWHGLVPVPLYPRHRRERGFNQAYELARGLASKRKIPVLDCLYRYRETTSQVGLERKARWQNMENAFKLKPRFDVHGQNLLLIDDVFTTGATTNACAQVLAQAGASQLAVLTVARS